MFWVKAVTGGYHVMRERNGRVEVIAVYTSRNEAMQHVDGLYGLKD